MREEATRQEVHRPTRLAQQGPPVLSGQRGAGGADGFDVAVADEVRK